MVGSRNDPIKMRFEEKSHLLMIHHSVDVPQIIWSLTLLIDL